MRRLLLLTLLCAALPAHADAVANLQRFFRDLQTYSARFEQVVVDAHGNRTQQSSGSMWIERPGKFRWDYNKPYAQHIIGDGKKIWIYDVDLQQVTVRPMSLALGDTPALLLAGKGQLEESFVIEDRGQRDGMEWVQLTPRKKDGGFEQIELAFAQGKLHTLELKDSFGQTTHIDLTDFRENPRIAPGMFRFKPPPGVDVIEQ
jgi:outer membrane lipoprotein carrier protein